MCDVCGPKPCRPMIPTKTYNADVGILKTVFGVITAVCVCGCAPPPSTMATSPHCIGRGETRLERHNSASLDSANLSARLGTLSVYVTGDAPPRAIPQPFVDIVADTMALNATRVLRSELGDSSGYLQWDSLPAGRYGLRVRRIGYNILADPVDVRAGGTDTLLVTLRADPMCHSPPLLPRR